jgi:hypothetical protein
MNKSTQPSNPRMPPARLVPQFDRAIQDLQKFGPMKEQLFINTYSRALLSHMQKSLDVKVKPSHIGQVVVLNISTHPKRYETYHTLNTLTSSLILRAALEKLCVQGEHSLESRSSSSARITNGKKMTLLLARHSQPKVKSLRLLLGRLEEPKPDRVIIVVPKKRKNFYRSIEGYEISILELGQSFAPVHNN